MSASTTKTPRIQTEKPELKKPPMYRVLMLNDDYTPMEFVVELLCLHFQHNAASAERIMMQIHLQGSAVCGVYPRDLAESKVARVQAHSRSEGHPLQCRIEPQAEE